MKKIMLVLILISLTPCISLSAKPDTKKEVTVQEKVNNILADKESRQIIHEAFSSHCFNKCWSFIDMTDRSPEDEENMILFANASLWHWKQRKDCKPINLSIGYWQVSRVYALAGQYEMAKLFGLKSLKIGQDNQLAPFYIGFAYEALARAELLEKNTTKAKLLLDKARTEMNKVEDKEEKKMLAADISILENLSHPVK